MRHRAGYSPGARTMEITRANSQLTPTGVAVGLGQGWRTLGE
jgi:hypothetical protein